MQSLNSFVLKQIFKSSVFPIVVIELVLILLIFSLGFLQEERNEALVQNTAAQSFEEVSHQVTERMNAKIERVQKDASALKMIIESLFENSSYYNNPDLSFFADQGFFIRENKGPSSIYTTNLDVLSKKDIQTLKVLAMAESSLNAVMLQYKGIVDSAWINIGKYYSLYYPSIVVQNELSSNLDSTQQSYYFRADAEHNPDKKTIFIPLFQEPWAVELGQIGSVVSPIYIKGKMEGVIGMTLTSENTEEISDITLPFGAYIILLGKEGHVLFTSKEEEFYEDFGIHSFNALSRSGKEGTLEPFVCSPGEESNFVFFQKTVQDTGLELVLIAKKDAINKDINEVYYETRKYGAISLLVIAFIHLFLFIYIRFNTKKVSKVISTPVQEIAEISQMLFDAKSLNLQKSDIHEFDILHSNLHKAHEKLLEQLYFDIQTHLPNLNKLHMDIGENSTLILVCVENYKMVKNIYGPKIAGDALSVLIEMLHAFPRSKMQLYRIYNDTFALRSDAKVHLQDELHYLYNRLSLEHVHLDEFDIALNYSLSLALPCADSELPLFARADIALDEAKRQKHVKYLSYDEARNEKELFQENQEWAKRFQKALHEHRLVPFFQPIYDMQAKRVCKFEALVRMLEEDEVISPHLFLGVAKKMGKMTDITLLMLRSVFDVACKYPEVEFSINTSFEDFEEANLMHDIQNMLTEKKVNTQKIIIEILETGKYKDEAHVIVTIEKLKDLGFKIAIDDFGAGNSNFAHLMLMQADYIKIDGQFVKNIASDEQSHNITKTINEFSHMTGAQTVAEFVSDAGAFEKVSELGIDFVQGYYICEPRPASQIDEMLSIEIE
jgi:EAL domain-containing protein (putative c-di-GMP-specific phosphodiesterase class I)/GGDEF domain-containing protein